MVPILSLIIWLPVMGAVAVMVADKLASELVVKKVAHVFVILNVAIVAPLLLRFDIHSHTMQFQEIYSWMPLYNIDYALGVDGISLIMMMLTNITCLVVMLIATEAIEEKRAMHAALLLLMQAMLLGVFAAMDAVLFYVFWEGMLIPVYLALGIWGDLWRYRAAVKLFLYMFAGSIFLLLAILYLHTKTGSFFIADFYQLSLPLPTQKWLFVALLLAFAIKLPMWPVHTWLLDFHSESPRGGSVVLTLLMLKIGVYGFLRFILPITPLANAVYADRMIILALIAIIYAAVVAIMQKDLKRLVAYSSISHMGFAVLGCFAIYKIMAVTNDYHDAVLSLTGAVTQMIAYAFGAGGLFLAICFLSDGGSGQDVRDFGGLARKIPLFSVFFMLFALANVGLPGTSGFVGEFMVIVSSFKASPWISALAALTLVLGASYTLWMVKRVVFGTAGSDTAELTDINEAYVASFVLLNIGVLVIGLYPEIILRFLRVPVTDLLGMAL